jgi:GT2 family glycosyltransferase
MLHNEQIAKLAEQEAQHQAVLAVLDEADPAEIAATQAEIARHAKKELQARNSLKQLQQSTSWRIAGLLRAAFGIVPQPFRMALRRGLNGVRRVLTPQKLRNQKALQSAPKQPSVPSKQAEQPKLECLSFYPDSTRDHVSRPADYSGRYVLEEKPCGYTYVPSRRPEDLETILAGLSRKLHFSIVVATYNTTAALLSRMLSSVQAQWYQDWQLIIADDASTCPETRLFLSRIDDPRIQILLLDAKLGVSGAINVALQKADGDFILFVGHGDELSADCLYELALSIDHEDPDYIYSDEDEIDEKGRFTRPFFKPEWSPDALMSNMYARHVSCVRRSLLQQVGLLRPEFDGSHDWDLVLRIAEATKRIAHIPKVLYHGRSLPAWGARSLSDKMSLADTGRRAREAAMGRRGLAGALEAVEQVPDHFRVRYAAVGTPLISIIIPSRNNGEVLQRCVDSLYITSTWRNFEVVILDNGSDTPETLDILKILATRDGVRIISHNAPFNYSELNNIGVREARGEILLFLNDDTELLTSDGLENMTGYAQLPHIAAVGAKLLYPQTMGVQHVGVINLAPGPSHAFVRQPSDAPGYFLRNLMEYNWIAVTGACLMIERTKFNAVGGFDESFPVAYNDVDLCFRLLKRGLYHVVCPSVRLLHYESLTRGLDRDAPEKRARLKADRYRLLAAHPEFLMYDPYFSPNLRQDSAQFDLPA